MGRQAPPTDHTDSMTMVLQMLHPDYREPEPLPPTFIVHIDAEEPDISRDVQHVLRAMYADLEQLLKRHRLWRHRSTRLVPGRVVCAIIPVTQYTRKLRDRHRDPKFIELIQRRYRFIVIDDRSPSHPEHVPPDSANVLTDLQRIGHLITAPLHREIGGTVHNNMLCESGIEDLLAELLNVTPFLAG